MNKIVTTILTAATLFTASCATNKELAKTPDGGNPLSFSCNNSTVTAKLKGNSSTGYSWQYKLKDSKIAKYVSDEYTANQQNSESPMIGQGGVHTFVFEGIKPGTTYVVIDYAQHWKKGKKAGVRIMMIMVDDQLKATAAEVNVGGQK